MLNVEAYSIQQHFLHCKLNYENQFINVTVKNVSIFTRTFRNDPHFLVFVNLVFLTDFRQLLR